MVRITFDLSTVVSFTLSTVLIAYELSAVTALIVIITFYLSAIFFDGHFNV